MTAFFIIAAFLIGIVCGVANARLIAMAPTLARKVIAAEKLAEANGDMEEAIRAFLAELRPNSPLIPKAIYDALQASKSALASWEDAQ